jgi:hypothetical protein
MLWNLYKKAGLFEQEDICYDVVICFLVASFLFFAGPRPIQGETKALELNFNQQTLSVQVMVQRQRIRVE